MKFRLNPAAFRHANGWGEKKKIFNERINERIDFWLVIG